MVHEHTLGLVEPGRDLGRVVRNLFWGGPLASILLFHVIGVLGRNGQVVGRVDDLGAVPNTAESTQYVGGVASSAVF